jgi:23S rRNA pseudouridine2605 synthase
VLSLARALSKFGVCSRAEAARWIEAGRVRVDGAVVRAPQRRINPRRQRVELDGARVADLRQTVAVALHKPPGYLTTRSDPGGRPTVYDLLGEVGEWVFPVGRLDRDTAGLLILTNDHRLGDDLTDPGRHVPKAYHARVRGVPSAAALAVLREGATLEDGTRCRPARVRPLGVARSAGGAAGAGSSPRRSPLTGTSWLEITLTEGKNRQVRRMCAVVGHEVLELVRVRIGALGLADLPPGAWRRLGEEDLARLRRR